MCPTRTWRADVLLTIAELAERLGCDEAAALLLVRRHDLPGTLRLSGSAPRGGRLRVPAEHVERLRGLAQQ